MGLHSLLGLERWAPLARFVARWYAEPLGEPGLGEQDIVAVEQRLGRSLPRAVREWYLLVGHRFCDVNQDHAQRLEQLKVEGNRLPIWWENQGCWSFDVELDSDDEEPWVSVQSTDEEMWRRRRARLGAALLGMVYSDTLVGIWAGRGVGPLGRLAPGVIGGYRTEAAPEVDDVVEGLPALEVVSNPFFEGPLRGHESLIVRGNPGTGMWEWMAASEGAYLEAVRILRLEEPEHHRVLVLAFDPLPREARDAVERLADRGFEPGEGLGRLRTARFQTDGRGAVLEFETSQVMPLLEALLGHLPSAAVSAMRAGHRSPFVMRFVPCWPPGLRDFVEPM